MLHAFKTYIYLNRSEHEFEKSTGCTVFIIHSETNNVLIEFRNNIRKISSGNRRNDNFINCIFGRYVAFCFIVTTM